MGREEGLLPRVVGRGVVARDRPRDAAHRGAVPTHELLERRAIAGLRGDDQLGFG